MREIKFQILWERELPDFTTEISEHYTTLKRLTSGKDKFPYDEVNVIAKRQYVGHEDCEGKEVYEGDIFHDGFDFCAVEWNNDLCSFVANDGKKNHSLELIGKYLIVGNIHQNPELLKETK